MKQFLILKFHHDFMPNIKAIISIEQTQKISVHSSITHLLFNLALYIPSASIPDRDLKTVVFIS